MVVTSKRLPGPAWYRFIYLHLGGIPFTWQMRRWGRYHPLPTMLAGAALLYCDWRWFGFVGTLFTGILLGHVFWGGKRTQ